MGREGSARQRQPDRVFAQLNNAIIRVYLAAITTEELLRTEGHGPMMCMGKHMHRGRVSSSSSLFCVWARRVFDSQGTQ
eukprot:1427192-Prymnesium_polylepis.1